MLKHELSHIENPTEYSLCIIFFLKKVQLKISWKVQALNLYKANEPTDFFFKYLECSYLDFFETHIYEICIEEAFHFLSIVIRGETNFGGASATSVVLEPR